MVQTPGNIKSLDNVAGGEALSFEVDVSVITAQLGTIPIFVVPAGENYRVIALRTVCKKIVAGTTPVPSIKITDGTNDITTAVTHAGAAIGAVLTPTILTIADVNNLSAAETLSIVTAATGTVTEGEFYVRIDLVRTTGNM